MSRILLIFFISCLPQIIVAQTNDVDSLLKKSYRLLYDNTNEAIKLSKKALSIAKNKMNQFDANHTLGECYFIIGDFDKSILYYMESKIIAESLKDDFLISKSLFGLGSAYEEIGEPERGLKLYFKALAIREKLKKKKDISPVLNNIAVAYYKQNKMEKAIGYMHKCASIDLEVGDSSGLGYSFSNLGAFFYHIDQNDSAIFYHNKALLIRKSLGEKLQIARSYNNIANVYGGTDDLKLAVSYYKKALIILRQLDNSYELVSSLSNLGSTLSKKGKPREGLPFLEEARGILNGYGNKSLSCDNFYALSKAYSKINQMDSAYNTLKSAYELKKEIYSETKSGQIEEMVAKYETEKTEKENEELKVQKAEDSLSLEKSKNRIYLLVSSILILILVAGFILTRLRVNKKTTGLLQVLYDQLEDKSANITDSIAYAKRIQSAILPPLKLVKEHLQDSFVLFKPKDIVAGDFYWMNHTDKSTLFAVCDCTGHGVPGAMVSVICNNALNRAIRDHGLTDPGEILDKTREIVIQEFEKSEEEVTDGMDIALCSLNGLKLEYAGANNPLWIIRQGEILETKANKQPIGKYTDPKPFTTHSFELEKGDCIYIFSDGYGDQFGGEKGKKFKCANLRKLLLSIQDKSIERQKELLDKAFESWRGDLEQIDDVCMIGIRV